MSESVSEWLVQLGLGQYCKAFKKGKVDLDLLPELDHATLMALGVAIPGHRLRILKAAKSIVAVSDRHRTNSDFRGSPQQGHSASPDNSSLAERRQLTVMFCDLAGSTELSVLLDPEVLRNVMRAYQRTAEEVILRYEGYIAQYLGDGLLVYFGYPVAHEDDAQRAVFAGIGIPRAIEALNVQLQADYSVKLSVRVGIHTGLVVVGEMGGSHHQERLAMGETPNRAARLQNLADPGTVVISDNTRRLIGKQFSLEVLQVQPMKGLATTTRVYKVHSQRLVETRFAAGHVRGVPAMVGRDRELALLLGHWQRAKSGKGSMILLSGEAGIGKSRIARGLADALVSQPHLRISYQCSPYHADTPLFPVIQQMNFAAGLNVGDTPEKKLDKVEAILLQGRNDVAMAAPLLGALLGLETVAEKRYGPLKYSPQQRRLRTLQVLIDQLIGRAGKTPVLIVLEDAHWIDPTMLALMEQLLEQIAAHRVFVLVTTRPMPEPVFDTRFAMKRLALGRLGREQIDGIVQRVAKGKRVPDELLTEIAAKTDGVPLFIEELTKTILESGMLRETKDAYLITGAFNRSIIPSSLHDSLMARLDRLKAIKQVAQTASCVGREFSFRLLAAASPLEERELTAALDELIATELLFTRGIPPEASYTFKHALVRDAAYESLLKSTRRSIHHILLNTLKESPDSAPEILAYHATEAGCIEESVTYWEQAGDQAIRRPAFLEAVNHFERAALAVHSLHADSCNRERELGLRLKGIHALHAAHGYAHQQTAAAVEEAYRLLDYVGKSPSRFPIYHAKWTVYLMCGEHREGVVHAQRMRHEADRSGDRSEQCDAYRFSGFSKTLMGDFDASEEDFEKSFERYDLALDWQTTLRTGSDVGNAIRCFWAISLLCRGEGQRAWRLVEGVEAVARHRGHPFTLSWALYQLANLHQIGRMPECEQRARKSLEYAIENGVGVWERRSLSCLGAVLCDQGRHSEAIEYLVESKALRGVSDGRNGLSYLLATHAASLSAVGNLKEAARTEREAYSVLAGSSEQWKAAEINRLLAVAAYRNRGEVVAATGQLQKAMEIAGRQGARLFHLRAAVSLARILADQRQRQQAQDILAPVVAAFPAGGRNLPDWVEAMRVQDDLA